MNTNLACSRKFWSREEDKAFENALAIYSGHTNRWEKITAAVPGRTIEEIKAHFELLCADVEAIHSGRVPLPQYEESSMKSKSSAPSGGKNNQSEKKPSQSSQGEGSSRLYGRKKGVPWSTEEHRSFLQGLKKYGRGDWRSISRHCVLSRTSTQVASHAQKYFKRLDEVDAANKRASIHDTDGQSVTETTLPEGQEVVKESVGNFPTLNSSDKSLVNENVGVHSSSYLPSENEDVDGSKHSSVEIPGTDLPYYPVTDQLDSENAGVDGYKYSSVEIPGTDLPYYPVTDQLDSENAGVDGSKHSSVKIPGTDLSYYPVTDQLDSENAGVDGYKHSSVEIPGTDLPYYPVTDQLDFDISIPKWPGTEQVIGTEHGLDFGPDVNQQGIFSSQGTSTHQMIGFTDADFIVDDWLPNQHGIFLQEPSYDQQMQEQALDNLTVTSQDYILTPEDQSFVQTVETGWESYNFNFGELASASSSSFNLYGHPTTSEWLMPPPLVASTAANVSDNLCSTIPTMYDSGAFEYGSYSPTAFDLAEHEFGFSPSSGQI